MTARLPMWLSAWPSPTVVVVLPSPSGVGVIAVTTTYFARGRSANSSIACKRTFARLDPYGSSRCSPMPISAAISGSGLGVAALAMARSDGNAIVPQYGIVPYCGTGREVLDHARERSPRFGEGLCDRRRHRR